MSNFEQFYKGVYSKQLVKDKRSMQKKYESCTEFGEGEIRQLRPKIRGNADLESNSRYRGGIRAAPLHQNARFTEHSP